ncbi:MAG: helix-turn-helix domain-containing protein [Pseudomonadota bacterium]|nr:helix-turn-helix domain-containing protein [Pseudomonadota bacterium]
MKTYDLVEAAEILKIHPKTLTELAQSGELYAAKIGRAWVFMERDLETYLRMKSREQTKERRNHQDEITGVESLLRKDRKPRGWKPDLDKT